MFLAHIKHYVAWYASDCALEHLELTCLLLATRRFSISQHQASCTEDDALMRPLTYVANVY